MAVEVKVITQGIAGKMDTHFYHYTDLPLLLKLLYWCPTLAHKMLHSSIVIILNSRYIFISLSYTLSTISKSINTRFLRLPPALSLGDIQS